MIQLLEPYTRVRHGYQIDTSRNKHRHSYNLLTRNREILIFPAFSYDNIWRGASEIIGRFIIQKANTNFSIQDIQNNIPENPNYVLAVSWYKDDITYRFKLWKDVGEIFYAPMYNGETITSDIFALEIWTTNTTPITSPGIEFKTSRLLTPTNFCTNEDQISNLVISSCGDPLFHFTDDAFDPANGDYYIFQDYCTRIIVRGNVVPITFPDNLLHCDDDDTWHYVWCDTVDGNIVIFIDQSPAPVGTLGFWPMVDQQNLSITIKIDLQLVEGTYHLNFDGEITYTDPFNVILLNHLDTQYYRLVLMEFEDGYTINVGQTPVVP
jgi:hypothetical protein